MKRVLFHVPAVIAGLLIGWLLSSWRGPSSAPVPPKAQSAKVAEREKGWPSSPGNLTAFEKLVNSRHALPEVPPDELGIGLRMGDILKANAHTPVRAALESEVFRNALSAERPWIFLVDANPDRSPGAARLVARWTKKNPIGALAEVGRELSQARKTEEETSVMRRHIFREWLQNDPQGALKAATDSYSILTRGLNTQALMSEWSRLDPAAAAAALTNLPEGGPGFERKDFAAILYRNWSASDPVAAQAWAQSQSDPALREALQLGTGK